jgi:hypothetical protein
MTETANHLNSDCQHAETRPHALGMMYYYCGIPAYIVRFLTPGFALDGIKELTPALALAYQQSIYGRAEHSTFVELREQACTELMLLASLYPQAFAAVTARATSFELTTIDIPYTYPGDTYLQDKYAELYPGAWPADYCPQTLSEFHYALEMLAPYSRPVLSLVWDIARAYVASSASEASVECEAS